MLDLATVLALAADCAPNVSSRTLAAVAYAESRFDALAIGVNRGAPLTRRPADRPAAIRMVRARLAKGENLDLGLAQINSGNLDRLGLSVQDVFDPCINLRAAGVVLGDGYRPSLVNGTADQAALRAALSRYNTGHPTRGVANGYVGRVEAALRRLFRAPALHRRPDPIPRPEVRSAPQVWDPFARARESGVVVFSGLPTEAVR